MAAQMTPTPGAGAGDMDSMYASEGPGDNEAAENPPESVDQEREEEDADSALIDNKILSPDGKPLKEGQKVTLTIRKVYGNESEVVCDPGDYKDGDDRTGMAADADTEIEGLDKGDI